jgi:hypothetical protein
MNSARGLLQNGYDIRTVQELPGHKDVKTTMIYTHVLNSGGKAVRSPLDCYICSENFNFSTSNLNLSFSIRSANISFFCNSINDL